MSELDMDDEPTVQIESHFVKPKDYATIREDQPQVEGGSKFQQEAASYLRSLGFKRVGIGVDIGGGSNYTSVHDAPTSDK